MREPGLTARLELPAKILTMPGSLLDCPPLMKRLLLSLATLVALALLQPALCAAEATSAGESAVAPATSSVSSGAAEREMATKAAATVGLDKSRAAEAPDLLEQFVDSILQAFDLRTSGNTVAHFVISGCLLVAALVMRRVVTRVFFGVFRRFASRTQTTLDDKLFSALEAPVGTLVMLVGLFAALKILKLPPGSDALLQHASTVAFSLAIFWLLLRALNTLLDHAHQVAIARSKGIAAFMPWIKKTLIAVFVVLGVLMVFQSLGFNVRAILAGLGLGGLAFALAAQDTLANVFGSIVVAIDQPFRIGEVVRIGGNVGGVEDIGLRSTRIRLIDKSLMVIPNKTVAAETITNLSRFTRRRFEQVIGLTYDTKPEQMDAMVEEIRRIITSQPEVDAPGVMVFFRDFSASSLDIWVVYEVPDPDFQKAMRVKQRINVMIMRAVEARGLSFAFPTQTVHLAGDVAERLAKAGADQPPGSVR